MKKSIINVRNNNESAIDIERLNFNILGLVYFIIYSKFSVEISL